MKWIIIFIILCGCAVTPTQKKTKLRLKYLSSYEINSHVKFKGKPFGGLSGIVYDKQSKLFWAISDDRSQYAPARVYKLRLVSFTPLRFDIVDMLYLRNSSGRFFPPKSIDFEGIALLPNGNFLLSSESVKFKGKKIPPRLMEFTAQGQFIKSWAVSSKYVEGEDHGVRENKSFEALVYANDRVYTAVENSLIEDGDIPAYQIKNNLRVLEYVHRGDHFVPCKEFVYTLSALPVTSPQEKGDTGLVEFLKYKDSLLALERSFIYKKHLSVIKLFKFDLGDNVKNVYSIKGEKWEQPKELVLDFAHLPVRLDNIEGMSWGPDYNGHRTIIFVSDNNFSKRQRTLFLLLEVVP